MVTRPNLVHFGRPLLHGVATRCRETAPSHDEKGGRELVRGANEKPDLTVQKEEPDRVKKNVLDTVTMLFREGGGRTERESLRRTHVDAFPAEHAVPRRDATGRAVERIVKNLGVR